MPAITLPKDLLTAWQDAVIELAKLPRGMHKSDFTDDQLLNKIMRLEMRGIHELWETFTLERDLLTKHLLASKQQMVRYLLGFHLPNAARMQLALERLNTRFPIAALLASGREIRWNDLGCGSGAAAQTALFYALDAGLKTANLTLHLTDASGTLLDTAREVINRSGDDLDIVTHRMPLEKLKLAPLTHEHDDQVSIYSLAYVWNELERNAPAQTKLREIFAQHLKRDEPALLIFLEPANQSFTRRIMEFRDDLVANGYLPLYPCPKAVACPMLERSRDWCYSEGMWQRPPFVQRLDQELRVDRSHLSSAIYIFATPALVKIAKTLPSARQKPWSSAQALEGVTPLRVIVGRPEKNQPSRQPFKATAKDKGDTPNRQRSSSRSDQADFQYLICEGEKLSKAAPEPTAKPESGSQKDKQDTKKAKPAAGKKLPGKSFRLRGDVFSS